MSSSYFSLRRSLSVPRALHVTDRCRVDIRSAIQHHRQTARRLHGDVVTDAHRSGASGGLDPALSMVGEPCQAPMLASSPRVFTGAPPPRYSDTLPFLGDVPPLASIRVVPRPLPRTVMRDAEKWRRHENAQLTVRPLRAPLPCSRIPLCRAFIRYSSLAMLTALKVDRRLFLR
jgi:hypothetical protein